MNPLTQYLSEKLEEQLSNHRCIVWYDPNREFSAFIDEMVQLHLDESGVPQNAKAIVLSVHFHFIIGNGSLFGVKLAAERYFAAEVPEPFLIYLPGMERDTKESPLMELELAGKCWTPQSNVNLKRILREVLRDFMTDGDIDGVLETPRLMFPDAVRLVEQRGSPEAVSILKIVIPKKDNASLLATWIAQPELDSDLESRDGKGELLKLVGNRLGLALPSTVSFSEFRTKVLSYLLVNDFRANTNVDRYPRALDLIPTPGNEDQKALLLKVLDRLRELYSSTFIQGADQLEGSLGLANERLPVSGFSGSLTFRFQEQALLVHCGEWIQQKKYGQALVLVESHEKSFWAQTDPDRACQWECLRLIATLGDACQQALEQVRQLVNVKNDANDWVSTYTRSLSLVDRYHRQLETYLSRISIEPESEQALSGVRRYYDDFVHEQAVGFGEVLVRSGWQVPGVLHQTRVYSDVVAPMPGPKAYFLIDAMRYEMAQDLIGELSRSALEMNCRTAIAALPTITPICMAALLPGASIGFSVIEHQEKLAANVDGVPLANWPDRWKYLQGKIPGVVELTLETLGKLSSTKLKEKIESAPLVVVRSQEIDSLGEMFTELASPLMGAVLGNIARGVRKLASAGIAHFTITADHGHLFSQGTGQEMITAAPGGDAVELKRRCWAGHGGTTPPSTVRTTGPDLGYSDSLEFIFPKGLTVLPGKDGLRYHHGGTSLQEMVIPVMTFRMASTRTPLKKKMPTVVITAPAIVNNRIFTISVASQGDLVAEAPTLRFQLMNGTERVGQIGMVEDAQWDRPSTVTLTSPTKPARLAFLLAETEDKISIRVVATDPLTDAVEAESGEIKIQLGVK